MRPPSYAWVVLLMAQSLLIRTGRWQIHRRLGIAAIGLAGVMLILGPAVAITIQRAQLGLAHPSPVFGNPAFLAVQLGGIIAFGVLVTAGFLLRRNPSAHRRLMLLATLAISDAGFARWTSALVAPCDGRRILGRLCRQLRSDDVLILVLAPMTCSPGAGSHPAWVEALPTSSSASLTATALLARRGMAGNRIAFHRPMNTAQSRNGLLSLRACSGNGAAKRSP